MDRRIAVIPATPASLTEPIRMSPYYGNLPTLLVAAAPIRVSAKGTGRVVSVVTRLKVGDYMACGNKPSAKLVRTFPS